ncbi:MAG: cytochrome c maturation protein CcmE [Egibacteraceae bacterium]
MRAAAPRVRLAVVGAVAVASLGVVAASGLNDSLLYYRTPSELSAQPAAADQRLRLGGMVQPGSVSPAGATVRFVLTDGAADVTVAHRGDPPGVFQEGQGALVEGTFGPDGVFHSDFLVVKHSNEYRGPDGEVYDPGELEAKRTRP